METGEDGANRLAYRGEDAGHGLLYGIDDCRHDYCSALGSTLGQNPGGMEEMWRDIVLLHIPECGFMHFDTPLSTRCGIPDRLDLELPKLLKQCG